MRFGVPAELVQELNVARPDEIVWLGRVPARVDFLQVVPGVEFPGAWSQRVAAEVDGVRVQFIGREDLVANKRTVARPQDLRDVRALERTAAGEAKPKARPRKKKR
jgi:hypothetical protein